MIQCILEDKTNTSFRHVCVGSIIINDKQEVLLVKRPPSLFRGDKYTIPGGYLERDETVEQGVLRELEEETGYKGEIQKLFHINGNPERPHEDRQNVDIIFITNIIGGTVRKNEEAIEIKWFGREHLPSEDDFAFDHRNTILKYYQYLQVPFTIPIIGEIFS